MNLKTIPALLFWFMVLPLFVFAQNQPEPLADEMEALLKSEPFNVGLLFQAGADFSFDDDNFNGGRRFYPGATRFSLGGRVDQNFNYKLQVDFRRTSPVMDAQAGYDFSDEFGFLAGAQKPYLSADLDPNPGATDFINRARLVGAMLNTRDIGLTAKGTTAGFKYYLGMYNGYGLSTANDNRFFYTGRVAFDAEILNGTAEIGFNGGFNRSQMEAVGNSGLVSLEDRVLYGVYSQYEGEEWFGTAEFLQTRFDRLDTGEEETITGFYVTVGNRISENSEVLMRWDHLSFDFETNSSELIILGFNHQATRLISFQANVLSRIDHNNDNQFGVSGMMQFQF